MHSADHVLLEVCDLEELREALECVRDEVETLPQDPVLEEEWLINLQNHMVWGSIMDAGDEEMTLVAGVALCRVAARYGVPPHCLPGRSGELAAWILPEPGEISR